MITNRLINWIKLHECGGNNPLLFPYYDDYAGTPYRVEYSIGYGHQIQPNESYMWGGITKAQAEAILISDIKKFQTAVKMTIHKPLTQHQLDALTNLYYAIGSGGASQIAALINAGVSKKILIPIWKNTGIYWQGKKWTNLEKMRRDEINMYYSDQWMLPTFTAAGLITILAIYQYNKHKKLAA